VQYHPEASPGPHDAAYFFTRFREMVERSADGESVTGAQICRTSNGADRIQSQADGNPE
jgi:hypothetical protein